MLMRNDGTCTPKVGVKKHDKHKRSTAKFKRYFFVFDFDCMTSRFHGFSCTFFFLLKIMETIFDICVKIISIGMCLICSFVYVSLRAPHKILFHIPHWQYIYAAFI